MTKMLLAEDRVRALKTAVALLIHQVGGLPAAASACRLQASALQECASRTHPERMLPIDVVLQLEAVAGEAIVTGAMARLQGLSLARPEAGAVPAIGAAVGTVAAQAGALASLLLAVQSDGVVDEAERAALRGLAEDVRNAADATLAGLAPNPALRVVA